MEFENIFTVRRIDPDTFDYPKVEVHTWSHLSKAGGSVDVEAKTPEGTRLTLYSEKIEDNRSVISEREYAQELADNWNENLKENWDNEILRCYREVLDYQQRKVNDFDKELAELEKYKSIVSKLEAGDV